MRIAPFLILSLLLAASCATAPPPPVPVEAPAAAVPAPPPVPEPVPPPPAAEPVPEPPAPPLAPEEPVFQVTPEKKETSLAEIKALVDKLNALIAKKSFSEWKTYLDQDYIRTYSNPAKLADVSTRDPLLVQLKKKLRNLEDYFIWEVVPSRINVVVDDIAFIDENRVNVYTVVDNQRVLLYLLKQYDKEWKISSW